MYWVFANHTPHVAALFPTRSASSSKTSRAAGTANHDRPSPRQALARSWIAAGRLTGRERSFLLGTFRRTSAFNNQTVFADRQKN